MSEMEQAGLTIRAHDDGPRGLGPNGGTSLGLVGDYGSVAQRIVALTEAGIETFLLQFQPFKDELRRFAEQIMPRVREMQRRRANQAGVDNSSTDYKSAVV
jgi:alkanesulfonate monooxygenase SsuD/methylene tetrahydromethanopterin reductase-like flavin-dependent oxidoreductase (luciferase family)